MSETPAETASDPTAKDRDPAETGFHGYTPMLFRKKAILGCQLVACALAFAGNVSAAVAWPEISDRLQPLGNPLHDFGYLRGDPPAAATTSPTDLRHYAGQLHFGYGDSAGGGGPKVALAYDLESGRWRRDSDPEAPWPEEQIDHFNVIGGQLVAHSYDGLRGGNRIYVRNVAGWRSVPTDLGDHMRDTWLFAGRWWVSASVGSGKRYPNIHTLPMAGEPGRFWPATAEDPTGFVSADRFLGARFFEYRGELHLSAGSELANEGQPPLQPYIISLDPDTIPRGQWRISVADARSWLGAGVEETSVGPIGDATSLPGSPPLLIFGHPLRSGGAAVVVATGITDGSRTHVTLPGLPPGGTLRSTVVLNRESRLFALTREHPVFQAADRRSRLWLHECRDPHKASEPDSWIPRWTCLFAEPRALEFVNGRFYLVQGSSMDYRRAPRDRIASPAERETFLINRGYSGAGSVWVFDPAGLLPTARAIPVEPSGLAGHSIDLAAEVREGCSPIVAIRYYRGEELVAEARSAREGGWPATWLRPPPGIHAIIAVAEDARGVRHGGGPAAAIVVRCP